jgi:hypothetical protein
MHDPNAPITIKLDPASAIFCRRGHQLAVLVRALRTVQKSSGTGYKTTAASGQATTLEKEIDRIVVEILGPPASGGQGAACATT